MTELTLARFHELEKRWYIAKLRSNSKLFHVFRDRGLETICGKWWCTRWPLARNRYFNEGDRLCPKCERLAFTA